MNVAAFFRKSAVLLPALLGTAGAACFAADNGARAVALDGTYQGIADGRVLAGGLKNQGSPAALALLPTAAKPMPGQPGQQDPYKLCQPVGPFRMMALPATKFELVAAPGRIVMLFEDIAHGYLRSLYTDRGHPRDYQPKYAFQGDSVARWEGDTLVVDTTGFNERTWLNDATIASDALHLVERIRPVDQGRFLEYRMTASDPKSLAKPYSYVRYFEKTAAAVEEDACEIENHWSPDL